MSLRVRLSIIVSLLFLSGMLLGLTFQISNAKNRVASEVESTARLTYRLLDSMLTGTAGGAIGGDNTRLLKNLQGIEDARHMDISLVRRGDPVPEVSGETVNAPFWFVNLVLPVALEFTLPVDAGGSEFIHIRTNPADEIAEVWLESQRFMLVLLLVLLFLNSILYVTVGHWFKPVKTIVAGLDEVERGKFSGHLSGASLPELNMITDKFNHLIDVLRRSKAENDRLSKRSLIIQEEERRHLARELHDEMGQSISAIKAIAFSISERTRELDAMSADGAGKIGAISNHVRDHVRSMMHRLRPSMLDEFGLGPALGHMVDEWNNYHRDIFCSMKIQGRLESLDRNQQINIYRIIQEALTNVASHARADKVSVSLAEQDQRFGITIRDDGCGFDVEGTESGMGLTGIRERVQALGGSLTLSSAQGQGTCIEIEFD